jgi:anti-sigma-K factor RskA
VNVQAYILSGIVESYVLGLASPEEQAEFESMAAQHPEVLQARIAFEIALEGQAMANAIEPPASVKDELREKLYNGTVTPVVPITNDGSYNGTTAPVRRINFWKYAAAASVVLLAGSLVWNVSMMNRQEDLQNAIAERDSRLSGIARTADSLQHDLAMMTGGNPNIKMAVMKGLDPAPQAFATIYWDTASHDVYLAAQNLPVPASDKQYQLWAIFNGKPVDLGVFDYKEEKLLIRAKNAQGAEAFAITLEEKGGSPVPKGTMYVMGKL